MEETFDALVKHAQELVASPTSHQAILTWCAAVGCWLGFKAGRLLLGVGWRAVKGLTVLARRPFLPSPLCRALLDALDGPCVVDGEKVSLPRGVLAPAEKPYFDPSHGRIEIDGQNAHALLNFAERGKVLAKARALIERHQRDEAALMRSLMTDALRPPRTVGEALDQENRQKRYVATQNRRCV